MRSKLLALAKLAESEQRDLYIVGGFVRDALRSIHSRDVDLVVAEDAEQFAKRAAWLLRGEYEQLDAHSQYSRIYLIDADGGPFSLDVSLMHNKGLVDDLLARDFSVNAMAVSLQEFLHNPNWQESIVDPCGGREDLVAGLLRLTTAESIATDPVRLFRSARFLVRLGLQFAPETLQVLQNSAEDIRNAQKMKLAMEFFQLLAQPYAAEGINILHNELAVLSHFFAPFAKMSQASVGEEAIFAHGLKSCQALDDILDSNCLDPVLIAPLNKHLRQTITPGRQRIAYLRLACLLHDIGKVEGINCGGGKQAFNHELAAEAFIVQLARRLCFCKEEEAYLCRLICNHSRPLYSGEVRRGAKLRFFKQFGQLVPELVLLSMANLTAKDGLDEERCQQMCTLLADYFSAKFTNLPDPLISAREIMEFFNLPPSRAIGTYLEAVYAAQIDGEIKNSREALSLVSTLLEQGRRDYENSK